ncbi:MAG: signal peptide peptidase SppA [Chitinophagaceae bacterium]
MRSFFKMFFASFLAMAIFFIVAFFLLFALIGTVASKDKPDLPDKSVLVLNLGQHFRERLQENPLAVFSNKETEIPGLYDVVRLLNHAKEDDKVEGILVQADQNNNGLAASDELRNALLDFKASGKFIIAHGDVMSQGAYFVASAAHKVYINPTGALDWSGFNVDLAFVKGTLDKMEIQPQIFYAGKFKSATEPFRTTEMTVENEMQTKDWLGDLYNYFLMRTSQVRKMDTATLHALANSGAIQNASDALRHKLVDGVKYDDEIKDEIKGRLKIDKYDKMSLVSINTYAEAANFRRSGSSRIAVIYAEGAIVDGKGSSETIGSDDFVKHVRKARLDKSIKAIVFRINSGGGSALASENIWRELTLAKKEKPVVVSFGDVAASGGYYIGAAADSIFSNSNTITGSIGVFGIIPNMQGFFKNKLGVTFDGVKTATYADAGVIYRPLNEAEKKIIQQSVDKIYLQFKQRVAQGRKKDINYIDSIAQGRVWSGEDAMKIGLVDKIGGLQSAVDCAVRMAKLEDYRIREYPEKENWLNNLLGRTKSDPVVKIKEQLGDEYFRVYHQMMQVKEMCGSIQTRLPFEFFISK